ncbi:TPA: hypothetical protein DEP96_02490 [Candidatus Uhrbacteria bacterium]|nr:hypothetical protein [Candidatus Uhrbacteria bacterium]
MHFIADTTWPAVFAAWQAEEGADPAWQAEALKRGFTSWADWRGSVAEAKLGTTSLDWQLFAFDNPMTEIPAMHLGPFKGWQSRVTGIDAASFADLINLPTELDYWSANSKILSLMNNFPSPTQFIAVIREDTGALVCLEGHHRATAVALAAKLGRPINFGEVTIAIARLPADRCAIFNVSS